MDYDDHYSCDRAYRELEDARPCVLRARGVLLMESDKAIVLEHNVHMSDSHSVNKRSDRHGIVKSCIVKVQHYGPEKI